MKKLKALLELFKLRKNSAAMEKLKSRKLLILLINGALTAIGSQLGLDAIAQQIIALISGVYAVSQGYADQGEQGAAQAGWDLKEKMGSRKLWLTVGATVVAILGQQLGLEDLTRWILTSFFGGAVISLGVADHGSQGKENLDI